MENQRNSTLAKQSEQLFNFYDRQRIGIISKKALIYYFGLIDRQITQEWLSSLLISQGLTLGEYINCEQFIRIMAVLELIPEQDVQS